MRAFYYKTFARVCLLPYIGGTVIHLLRLIFGFPIEEIPFEVDWVVVLIGGYAGLGLLIFASDIPFKSVWDKVAYGLLVFHLDGSVILHTYMLIAGDHHALRVFPYWYSFVALGYFIALGVYVLKLNQRLYHS